jgi:CheY-like chemotaxis protein
MNPTIARLQNNNYSKQLKKNNMKANDTHIKTIAETFLGNINHEIRTPLNAILGFSELLKIQNQHQKEMFLNIIIENVHKLIKCIEDLTLLSQLKMNHIVPEYKNINTNHMLQYIFNNTANQYKKIKDGTIQLLLKEPHDNKECIVNTDESIIIYIFKYLLHNAVKHTNKGYIKFGYHQKTKDQITFFVKDTGKGVPQEITRHLFNNLLNDETQINKHNTDAGLTICKQLISTLKGNVYFESEPEKGATFYFSIPCQTSKKHPEGQRNMRLNKKSLNNKTILLVDEDENTLLYLKEILENHNINVLSVTEAHQAIKFIKRYKDIDMILMNIQLPDMDGYETSGIIKNIRNDIPLIIQAGYSPEQKDQGKQHITWDDHILKPISSTELIQKIAFHFTPQANCKNECR